MWRSEMKQKTFGLVGLAIYATGWITAAAMSVGAPSSGKPVDISLPFMMVGLILTSAFLGYCIGKDD
jgi:hypothetical protein